MHKDEWTKPLNTVGVAIIGTFLLKTVYNIELKPLLQETDSLVSICKYKRKLVTFGTNGEEIELSVDLHQLISKTHIERESPVEDNRIERVICLATPQVNSSCPANSIIVVKYKVRVIKAPYCNDESGVVRTDRD